MSATADLVRRHHPTSAKLSSNMDFLVLDEMLISALTPLESETEAYQEWLGEVMAFTLTSRRRANDALVAHCVLGLLGAPSAPRVVASGIDRDHAYSFLSRVQVAGKSLEAAQVERARHHGKRVASEHSDAILKTQRELGEGPRVAPAVRASAYWLEKAVAHKASIVSHYMQLLFKVSSRISHASGNRVEVDSAFGDAYVTASSAVNRFRAERGVFASYLGICLKGSSRESASNALGLAAPGARVLSKDALQAGNIDAALELHDPAHGDADYTLVHQLEAISMDPDVRAFLMLSDVVPPAIARFAGAQ